MLVFVFIVVLVVFVFHVATFSPQQLAVLFVGLIVFFLAFLKIDVAIMVLIFSMLLSPELQVGSVSDRAVTLRLDDIFLLVIFLGWLAKLSVYKELGLVKKTPLNAPIFLYIFTCVLSTALMLVQGHGSLVRSFFYLLKYFEYFLVYLLVISNIHDLEQVKRFVALMLVTCFIVCVYALFFYFATGGRASAPFEGKEGEANTLSGYIVMLFSLMLGLLLYHDSRRMRVGLVVLMPLTLLALVFTLSRSGWISFIFMYVVFIFISKKAKPFLIMGFVLLLVLTPVLVPKTVHERASMTFVRYSQSNTYRFFGKQISFDESASARINSWEAAFKRLMKKPLFGHGIPSGAVVDNQYARVMTETGIFGFLAFLFLLRRIFQIAYATMMSIEDNGFARGITVGFLAGFFGILAHCFTAATFILIRIMEPFWFLMAVIVVLPELLEKIQKPKLAIQGT